jgi:hypothetical protein
MTDVYVLEEPDTFFFRVEVIRLRMWSSFMGSITDVVTLKANAHSPHRYRAVPLPCRATLIHTCHAAPLPFSDSAVSFVKVRVVAGNIRTASPAV